MEETQARNNIYALLFRVLIHESDLELLEQIKSDDAYNGVSGHPTRFISDTKKGDIFCNNILDVMMQLHQYAIMLFKNGS